MVEVAANLPCQFIAEFEIDSARFPSLPHLGKNVAAGAGHAGERGEAGVLACGHCETRTGGVNPGKFRPRGLRNPFHCRFLKSHGWTGFWAIQMLVFPARSNRSPCHARRHYPA